jgi:hypothetical protein
MPFGRRLLKKDVFLFIPEHKYNGARHGPTRAGAAVYRGSWKFLDKINLPAYFLL